jgi:hypothetical protein
MPSESRRTETIRTRPLDPVITSMTTESKLRAVQLEASVKNIIQNYDVAQVATNFAHYKKNEYVVYWGWGDSLDDDVREWVTTLSSAELMQLVPFVEDGSFDSDFLFEPMKTMTFDAAEFSEKREAYIALIGLECLNEVICVIFSSYVLTAHVDQESVDWMVDTMTQ